VSGPRYLLSCLREPGFGPFEGVSTKEVGLISKISLPFRGPLKNARVFADPGGICTDCLVQARKRRLRVILLEERDPAETLKRLRKRGASFV